MSAYQRKPDYNKDNLHFTYTMFQHVTRYILPNKVPKLKVMFLAHRQSTLTVKIPSKLYKLHKQGLALGFAQPRTIVQSFHGGGIERMWRFSMFTTFYVLVREGITIYHLSWLNYAMLTNILCYLMTGDFEFLTGLRHNPEVSFFLTKTFLISPISFDRLNHKSALHIIGPVNFVEK